MEPLNLRSSSVRHSHFRQRSLAAMGIALLGASLGLAVVIPVRSRRMLAPVLRRKNNIPFAAK